MASSSSSLSLSPFSSSFLPSPLLHLHNNKLAAFVSTQLPSSTTLIRCAFTSTTTSSSSYRNSAEKKRHWKVGEYPGTSDSSSNSTRRFGNRNGSGNRNRNGSGNQNRSENRNRNGSGNQNRSENRNRSGNASSNTMVRTPNKNIKKKLDRKNDAKAWANTVTEALSHLIQTMQWLQALEVFEMLKEQPFYQPKEGTYMKLIVLLGKSRQPQHAHQLFDTMLEEGLEPTLELYTALLAAYCRSNLIEEAFSILDKMKTLPLCQPDVYTYSILIKACVDASRFELVESLYEQMAERSIAPNTVTQNIVLSGYGKAGKLEQMEKVLSGMLESTTCRPDVWTMNNIVSLFGNKGQIDMMERWYEKFRDFGIEPETRTFNILIGAYGKKRMYDKMSSVMEYMRKLSFPWTTSTYNNVIEAFSESGDAKHMEYTFDQMRAERMRTDTKTFCCLIRGYANAGLFHKVISTVQLAGKLEIPENTSFYNAVIFACAKLEDLMEMERVFKRMKDNQCPPDSTTYSLMVDAYKREGMSDKVYDLEQEQQLMALSGPKDDEAMETLLDV